MAYTLTEQSPVVPFNADNELVPPLLEVQTHLTVFPGRYNNAVSSAAVFLSSGPTFAVDTFSHAAEVIVTDVLMVDKHALTFHDVHHYTMAAIELRLRPFVVPDAHLRQCLSRYHSPVYQPTPLSARTHALHALDARRGVPVYLNGNVFHMRTRADVQTCIDLQLVTPQVAGQPRLLPVDRVSTRFTPQAVSFLRSTVANFDAIVYRNAQSAYDLGLSDITPVAHTLSSGEPATVPTFRRDPYMTRGRTARLRAESGEPTPPRGHRTTRTRRPTPSSSTAVGPLQGTTTSRTASTPIVDTLKGDFVAAGERVVPDAQPAVLTASKRETS